jgi:heavy metal translocating P-type ATPase
MTLLAAATLGGAAIAGGSYSYYRMKAARNQARPRRPSIVRREIHILFGELRQSASAVYEDSIRPKGHELTSIVKERAHVAAVSLYEEAQAAVEAAATEFEPLRRTAASEWRAIQEAVAPEDGLLADTAGAAREFLGQAAAEAGKALNSSPLGKYVQESGRNMPLSPRAIWRSLKQAKELVFDDTRTHQMEAMSEPLEGSARSQIALAEQTVNRYLKVAAAAVAAATIGLAIPPMKLVSGALILWAAIPVFKGAYDEAVHQHRISIRLLDSISFIGLLAGGYFLICSITAVIFHSSMKMMLKTEDRSRAILANMFGQQPRTVVVLLNGVETEIPFEHLAVGATLVVHAGQMIPIDGVISGGTAAVDQHILTGEAQPAEKGVGDRVFAATMMLAGRIEVQVQKAGSETAAAQIRDMLATTSDFRSAIQVRWRHVGDQTVMPTLGLCGVALAFIGPVAALAVLNSNYVAVMKVASPLGMLNFLQRASQAGVLIKDGRALESAARVDTVIFDKTGTLTETQPHLGAVHLLDVMTEDELLTYAAAVEANQSHPTALAILEAAALRRLVPPPLEDARYEMGYGIEARIAGRLVRVGSARYMDMQGIAMPDSFQKRRDAIQAKGASMVYVAIGSALQGALELRPTLRPEAKDVIAQLKKRKLKLHIISGDQAAPTEALATEVGIDHYFAEVLPQDKSRLVEELQQQGRRVCFVGDGINDAIALKKANVAVSLRGASSLATNTAQIILMDETLRQLPKLFETARDYDTNLKTLITTTFVPGVASLAGVFLLGTGITTALVLFNLSMVAGLVNAIWPALQNIDESNTELPAGKGSRKGGLQGAQ